MEFTEQNYAGDVLILNRSPFEAVPYTLDFSGVESGIVKAGSPIGADGTVDNTSGAVGILLHDVTKDRPQGALLKKAYINTAVAEEHSGITYDSGVKSALPMIVFE